MAKYKQPRIPLDERPLVQRINWFQTLIIITPPLFSIVGVNKTPLCSKTLAWSIIYYVISMLGITAGYHRYYSHRAYKATLLYRLMITLFGTAAFQGSILFWVRDHRIHHRFTDTDKDPYDITKGVLWGHIGWLIFKKDSSKLGRAEIDDLENDPIVMFQNRHFLTLGLLAGFVVPTLVAGCLWGDWRGGFVYAGVTRQIFVLHSVLSINSIAHWLGHPTFDETKSPRDNMITSIITMGEGYHNFHHEFPNDYRCGVKWYHYDPTKWFLNLCSLLGLVYDLKIFPDNEIRKGEFLMREKMLNRQRSVINWGIPVNSLPSYSIKDYTHQCQHFGKQWVVVESIIINVEKFKNEHPGGMKFIQSYIGKDATEAFNGLTYDHSSAARNLMSSMRVGKIA